LNLTDISIVGVTKKKQGEKRQGKEEQGVTGSFQSLILPIQCICRSTLFA